MQLRFYKLYLNISPMPYFADEKGAFPLTVLANNSFLLHFCLIAPLRPAPALPHTPFHTL